MKRNLWKALCLAMVLGVLTPMSALADVGTDDSSEVDATGQQALRSATSGVLPDLTGDPDPYSGTGQPEDATATNEPSDTSFPEPTQFTTSQITVQSDGSSGVIDPALPAPSVAFAPKSQLIGWTGNTSALSADIKSELLAAGFDPATLNGGSGATAFGTWYSQVTPDLLAKAGDCPMQLGDYYLTKLKACAAAATGTPASDPAGVDIWGPTGSTAPTTYHPPTGPTNMMAIAPPDGRCVDWYAAARTLSRKEACWANKERVDIVDTRTNRVAGSFVVHTVSITKTWHNDPKVYNDTYYRLEEVIGVAAANTYPSSAQMKCKQSECKQTSSWASIILDKKWNYTQSWAVSNAQSGQAVALRHWVEITVSASNAGKLAYIKAPAITPRCDNNVINSTGHGCVYPNSVPVLDFSGYGEVATHINKALATGLPSTLVRTWPSVAKANRAKACAGATKPPYGQSCDEYPFASSAQGAFSGGGTYRVPPGCGYAEVAGTGKKGWSRCQISLLQNTQHGNALGNWYRYLRIIPGDKFVVKV